MKLLLNEVQNKELIHSIKGDPDLLINKYVKVYYDITRHMFSVTFGGIVVLKADYVRLKNVKFLIGEKGKEKVRSEKQKNVHAYVTGTLVDYCEFPCDNMPTPETNTVIKYNPYFDETFLIKKTKEPIYRANDVQMINLEDKIFLVN
jgi:hypothetical protein